MVILASVNDAADEGSPWGVAVRFSAIPCLFIIALAVGQERKQYMRWLERAKKKSHPADVG